MELMDLTHVLAQGMPVYPGTEPPEFTTPCTVETHGFREQQIRMYSHTGTHMDAPAHILANGRTLDQYPIDHFTGRAMVFDLSQMGSGTITRDMLESQAHSVSQIDYVLIHSGWDRYWGDDQYFTDYPVLDMTAAQWLAQFCRKGIGLDMISIDGPESTRFSIHRVFLEKQMVIIENLTHLDKLIHKTGTREFTFVCLPLNIHQADGSPVRAIAMVP